MLGCDFYDFYDCLNASFAVNMDFPEEWAPMNDNTYMYDFYLLRKCVFVLLPDHTIGIEW